MFLQDLVRVLRWEAETVCMGTQRWRSRWVVWLRRQNTWRFLAALEMGVRGRRAGLIMGFALGAGVGVYEDATLEA